MEISRRGAGRCRRNINRRDVVFSGNLNANFFALDAGAGGELYKFNTGDAISGGVVTYEGGGKQM